MARPLRIEVNGALYHVTSRGGRRANIYEDDKDRGRFLEVLSEAVQLALPCLLLDEQPIRVGEVSLRHAPEGVVADVDGLVAGIDFLPRLAQRIDAEGERAAVGPDELRAVSGGICSACLGVSRIDQTSRNRACRS